MKQYLVLVVGVLLLSVSVCNAAQEKVNVVKVKKIYSAKYPVVSVVDLADVLKKISSLEKRVKELERNE